MPLLLMLMLNAETQLELGKFLVGMLSTRRKCYSRSTVEIQDVCYELRSRPFFSFCVGLDES